MSNKGTKKSKTVDNKGPFIAFFMQFKGRQMVRIGGNFFGGGFNLSRNKLLAIVDLLPDLQPFIDGKLEKKILALPDGETMNPPKGKKQ